MTAASDAADRLEGALDPAKRDGWSRLMGDEIEDLRIVVAAVRDSGL